MAELSGRVALVTGSAHRLGKAIALELARAGCDLLVHYHHSPPEQVSETLAELRAMGHRAHAFQADLARRAQALQLIEAADRHFGRLDILVNSAAIFQQRELLAITAAEWEETLAVNLSAPFYLTQAAARLMQRGAGGVIIHIGDYGSLQPWPRYPHHGVSKAALLMLTRTSALCLAPSIRVNAVIPGLALKPAAMSEAAWAKMRDSAPLGDSNDGNEAAAVARAVRYLAGESSITGAILPVDGGHSLSAPPAATAANR